MTGLKGGCIYGWMATKEAKILIRVTADRKTRWQTAAEADARSLTSWMTVNLDRAADTAGVEAAPKAPKPRGKRAKN